MMKRNISPHSFIRVTLRMMERTVGDQNQPSNRIQTGLKSFSCSDSGKKKYPQKKSLTNHMRIHSEGKESSCSVCKKMFHHGGKHRRETFQLLSLRQKILSRVKFDQTPESSHGRKTFHLLRLWCQIQWQRPFVPTHENPHQGATI